MLCIIFMNLFNNYLYVYNMLLFNDFNKGTSTDFSILKEISLIASPITVWLVGQ